MNRKFLEDLGIEKETIDKILDENSKDIGREKAKSEQLKGDLDKAQEQLAQRDQDLEELKKSSDDVENVKKQLEELQEKYNTETEAYKAQIADRDYSDAVNQAIAAAGVKFSSKSAERAYISELKAKKLEVKDGKLVGYDDFHKAQVEADPTAFESNDANPKFAGKTGTGGKPSTESKGAMYAKQFNEIYNPKKE